MSGRGRRIFPRWALHAAVDVESEDCLYAGLSYDVSAGGIFVATVDTPPIGADVEVIVTLPDATRLELSGVVRWVREPQQASPGLPAGVGIEWDALPMDALRSLLRFAELREPIYWEAAEPEIET
ncbi:MAG TPA: PilZ domain-containing protein [Polyangia bacterium]